jgi:hypothetical protein
MTTIPQHPDPWSLPRRLVAGAAAALAAIVWTHGFAALLRHLGPADAPLAAIGLSLAAVAVALAGTLALPSRRAELIAACSGLLAAAALDRLSPGSGVAALALVPVGPLVTLGGRWLGRRLPGHVDEVVTRRRTLALAWALLALVSIVQTGRLATAMTDREIGLFLTTGNPFWHGHECIGAYLYGAELSLRGEENVYHASHYLGLDPHAAPDSALEGVAFEDPYQYPPQFLLLPRLALSLTHDVPTLRVTWYALQTTLFALVATLLALWIGGRPGRVALWTLPLVMVSFPALHNFQFGQFHLPAIALAVAAMLAFARHRRATGGALLAVAILAKMFPAVLLALLLGQCRLRELAWTAAFGALITLVALAVLGPAPFVAFFDYHLPRLGDASAFAFGEAWPELAELVVIDNQGVFGLALKLGVEKTSAGTASRLFGIVVFVVAAVVGLRRDAGSRLLRASSWLALLGLGSLASPGAWGDYVPVVAVWLLSLLAVPLTATRGRALAFGLAAVFQFFVLGTMPLGSWAPIGPMLVVSAAGALILLALFGGTLAVRPAPGAAPVKAPRPSVRLDRTAPVP